MVAQRTLADKSFLVLAFSAAAWAGCSSEPPAAPPKAATAEAGAPGSQPAADLLGRAGPVTLDLAGFREALDEARILQMWRTGQPPTFAPLRNPMLRRRLLTQALETRVIRAEAAKRGALVPPEALRATLANAAAGRPPNAPAPEALPDPAIVDTELATRYGAPAERVRRVAQDVLESRFLADALLAATPEDTLRATWLDEETRVRLDVIQVPRVPTFKEIDDAIRERQPDITRYYETHASEFHTPERSVLRVVVVAKPGDAGKAEAEALRARVAGGADLAEVARKHSADPSARRDGLLGAVPRAQLPAGHDAKVGELSPILPHRRGGWVFFRLEQRYPAVERPLSDVRVQREIAATLLREADALPHARQVAERARQLLAQTPGGQQLATLIEEERLKRHSTDAFSRGGPHSVPGIGLAPELFDAAFRLSAQSPVTPVVKVRQVYVVARRLALVAPDPATWPEAKAAFVARWKARQQPVIVDEWLSQRLKGEPLWIDQPRLAAMSMAELGLPDEAPATQEAAPDAAPSAIPP